MAKIKKTKIEDLIPDDLNFNKGTQFGQSMIEKSLRTFGAGRSILLDKNNKIIAGNKTTEGFASAGMEDVIIVETTGNELVAVKRNDIDLDTKEGRELALADNATAAANLDWDEEAIAKAKEDFGIDNEAWGVPVDFGEDSEGDENPEKQLKRLKDDFILPPFSVLNTRTAEWQERRRAWLEIGIKSDEGRSEDLTFAKTAQPPIFYDTKNALRETLGREPQTEEVIAEMERLGLKTMTTTSIFDPVLTELSYRWFNIEGGRILDPFAGGSVRGIVAAKLNMPYVGNDLSDISNMDYAQFIEAYKRIIKQSCSRLKNNRFAVFVVGDIRDKKGIYRNFVSHTIEAFTGCGLHYYNSLILVNQITSLAIRVRRQFNGTRKVGKVHQNVLVFCKGSVEETIDSFEELQVKKALEIFNKSRENSNLHDDVLVFYKGDPKNIKEDFGELHISDELPQ